MKGTGAYGSGRDEPLNLTACDFDRLLDGELPRDEPSVASVALLLREVEVTFVAPPPPEVEAAQVSTLVAEARRLDAPEEPVASLRRAARRRSRGRRVARRVSIALAAKLTVFATAATAGAVGMAAEDMLPRAVGRVLDRVVEGAGVTIEERMPAPSEPDEGHEPEARPEGDQDSTAAATPAVPRSPARWRRAHRLEPRSRAVGGDRDPDSRSGSAAPEQPPGAASTGEDGAPPNESGEAEAGAGTGARTGESPDGTEGTVDMETTVGEESDEGTNSGSGDGETMGASSTSSGERSEDAEADATSSGNGSGDDSLEEPAAESAEPLPEQPTV